MCCVDSVTPWTVTPPPGDLANPGIQPRSPALQADSLSSEQPEKPSDTVSKQETQLCLIMYW